MSGGLGDGLRVVVVYPDLLGTYGDGGNGLILARRAAWRGIASELIEAPSGQPLPTADLYCLGGGEDAPQGQAAQSLRADAGFARAVGGGAVVLAVCAGYQIAGTSFPSATGAPLPGAGLLDVATTKGTKRRAVGEVLAEPVGQRLPILTGFENHGGVTRLGANATPLANVRAGVGNGDEARTEGAWAGRVLGTYLHGPVLARNPALADLLLGWATGAALAPLDDETERALRNERVATLCRRRLGRRRPWVRGRLGP